MRCALVRHRDLAHIEASLQTRATLERSLLAILVTMSLDQKLFDASRIRHKTS